MDPNAALNNIRLVISKILNNPEEGVTQQELIDMAESFDGLDKWLSNGNFFPADWDQ